VSPLAEVTVVVATRNRCRRLLDSVRALLDLPDRPRVIVVDNGSSDGTADAVRSGLPGVRLIRLADNHGAVARNFGVAAAGTPVVAFADDDSGWAPGALTRAARLFEEYPRLALAAAQVRVGPAGRLDPNCALMARAPLGTEDDLPGPAVVGFLAFAAAVRRDAFLATGGFDSAVFFMGEEERVAYDLQRAGWALCYCPELVAFHHPDRPAPEKARERRLTALRNHTLTSWMCRPLPAAATATAVLVRHTVATRQGRRQLYEFCRRLPVAIKRRQAPSPLVERRLRAVANIPTRVMESS
jgi:GT2 family glycosyltransferase